MGQKQYTKKNGVDMRVAHITMKNEDYEALERIAEEEQRSVSSLGYFLLKQCIEKKGK